MKKMHRISVGNALLALTVALLLQSCATKDGTGSAQEPQLPVVIPEDPNEEVYWSAPRMLAAASSDPIEGFNRSMFFCTDTLMTYVAKPIGWIWGTVLPRPVIQCIENACHNLAWPGRLISSLGCADWESAGVETVRFLTNSTIGIAGLFDPAQYWFNFYKTDAGFDRMFWKWGIGTGCRFLLPLADTADIRETVGMAFDSVLDIRTYLPYSSWAYVNNVVFAEDAYASAMRGAADPYRTYLTYHMILRELERGKWFYEAQKSAGRGEIPELPPEKISVPLPEHFAGNFIDLPGFHPLGADIDTLRSVFFVPQRDKHFWYMRVSLFNNDFAHDMSKRKVSIDKDRSSLRYGYWEVPKELKKANPDLPEQLVILVPGISGIYDGGSTTALAELYNNAGYKVVTIDNALSWRFMDATDGKLPGYTPEDVKLVRKVLRKIIDDLKEDEKINQPRIVLAGWSMGGLHTLFTAAAEAQDDTLGIDRFVALNPPADLMTAAQNADSFMKPSMKWTFDEAKKKITEGGGMQYMIGSNIVPSYDPSNPETFTQPPLVDSATAGYFIAASLQSGINEIILTAHKEKPFEFLNGVPCNGFNREDFYRMLSDVGFSEYINKYLMTRFPNSDLQQLNAQAGLYAIQDTLLNNPKIAVVHAWDDILLSDKDRSYLDSTLKKKITWFPYGGHCGQFYTKPFQKEVLRVSAPVK